MPFWVKLLAAQHHARFCSYQSSSTAWLIRSLRREHWGRRTLQTSNSYCRVPESTSIQMCPREPFVDVDG